MIIFQIITLILMFLLAFTSLRKWREIILIGVMLSFVMSMPALSQFFKNYIILLSLIVSFVMFFFRKTFPSIVYDVNVYVNKRQKQVMLLIATVILALLNYLQFKTGLLMGSSLKSSQAILFNISSEQILRFTAISLMFITVAISRTGEIDD